MNKCIYLIRELGSETYEDFHHRVKAICSGLMADTDVREMHYCITLSPPPSISIIPFRRIKIAAISVYGKDETALKSVLYLQGVDGIYNVEEALPVSYTQSWPDGSPTPGICMLTLFSKKKDISHNTFIDRWHNSHTPMSLRYHPLWHYNRNVVTQRLTESSPPFDGIVEEHMKTKSELLNPFKFFGPLQVIVPRMINVYKDTKSFIDYPTMEVYLTQEFILKSSLTPA
jgi:hypothetical protein